MNLGSSLASLLSMLALGGCAVGITTVHKPGRLRADSLPRLDQRLTFDVCSPGRMELADRIQDALARAGVQADLVASPGMPAHFTVAQRERTFEGEWSMILSLFTFSVIPGYVAERYDMDVDVAVHSGDGGGREHIVYERGVNQFAWLPFAVHPDFFGGLSGGWESTTSKELHREETGLEETVQRLADDLRVRFGRDGDATSSSLRVRCPAQPVGKWSGDPVLPPPR